MNEAELLAMSYPELVAECLKRLEDRLQEQIAIRCAFDAHEWFYGVPCGPTLSMIDRTMLGYVGPSLAELTASAQQFLTSAYATQPRWLEYDEGKGVMYLEVRPES